MLDLDRFVSGYELETSDKGRPGEQLHVKHVDVEDAQDEGEWRNSEWGYTCWYVYSEVTVCKVQVDRLDIIRDRNE